MNKLMSRDHVKTYIKSNYGRFGAETAVKFARQLYDVMGENEKLKHDIERQMTINTELCSK